MEYMYSPKGLQFVSEGKFYSIPKAHPNFKLMVEAVKDEDWDRVLSLVDVKKSINEDTSGTVEVRDDGVYYKGEPQHGSIVDRILEFKAEGLDISPLVSFLERLQNNPSNWVLTGLFDFLEKAGAPLTKEGMLRGYKGVRKDLMDVHSGQYKNAPGTIHQMPRNAVCDNRQKACAAGFHIGSYEYASKWGPVVMEVEYDPADVVSVPINENEKLRVCKYKVIQEIKGKHESLVVG